MKGIIAYHLINIAAFKYSKCNVDGHCQYIGHNGNGKTTNLRVPLYFYNPSGDRRDHAIESSKHSFNDFYFNGERSFIVYEVCRAKLPNGMRDLYHIAVNRRAGSPRFIFIDAPYNQSLYENANGHVCNERELIGNLQVAGIKSESANTYEAYRSVIYGVDYPERFKPFVYAYPKANAEKHIRTIPKILSAIFRAENSKTETLKDALIASLGEEEVSIDLRQTGKEMKQFNRDRTELMQLEGQLERIKCICSDYAEYKDHRADLSNLANRIRQSLSRAEHCLSMESVAIRTLEMDLSKAEKVHDQFIQDAQYEITECNRLEGSINQTIQEIRKIQEDYPEATLEAWERSERELPSLKQAFEESEANLKALIQEYESIEEKYQMLAGNIKTSYGNLRQGKVESYNKAIASFIEKIGQLQDEASSKIAELRESFDSERSELNETVASLREQTALLKQQKDSIRLDDFRGPAIRDHQTHLDKLRNDYAANDKDSKGLLDRHRAINTRRDSGLFKVGQKYDSVIRELKGQAQEVQVEIDKQRPIIERYAGSLLETIDREDIQPNVFRSVVNEKVLLLRSDSLLKQGPESPNSALLGLHIDTDSLPDASELNLEEAQNKFAQFSERLEVLNEKIDVVKANEQFELNELEVNYQRDLKEHQKYADAVRSEARRLLSEIEICQKSHEAETAAQKREFEATVKDLEAQHQTVCQLRIEASLRLNEFNTSCAEKEKELKCHSASQIEDKRKEQEDVKVVHDEELQSIADRLSVALAKLEKEKNAELKSGSHQPDEIDRVRELKDNAQSQFDAAKQNAQDLNAYREHRLPTVQLLPHTLTMQKENSHRKKVLEAQVKSEDEGWKEKDAQFRGRLQTHRDRQEGAQSDIKAFNEWESENTENESSVEVSVFNYTPGDIQKTLSEYQQAYNRMRVLWDGKPDTRTSSIYECGIKANVDYLISRFGKDNRFNFPSIFEADENIREFIDYKLSAILSTDSLDKERKQVLEAFRLTMSNLSREYQSLEDSKTRLLRTLNAIQKSIASDGIFVASINSIEFDLHPAKSRTGQLRDALKSCINKLDPSNINLDTVQDDLFAHKPSKSEVASLMDQVNFISNDINDHNIDQIRLGDLIDLVIRITENGVSHGWKPLVQGVGSEGTGALAKFIIYSGILSHFKKSVYKNADELHLHCMIDEIGKIYAGYVTELLNYCRKLGIYLATAQPNTHSKPGDFERTFMIDRNDKTQRARVTPVLEARVRIG